MLKFSTPEGNESCTQHISLIPLTVRLRCLMGFHCTDRRYCKEVKPDYMLKAEKTSSRYISILALNFTVLHTSRAVTNLTKGKERVSEKASCIG